jgi:hypothetical protein
MKKYVSILFLLAIVISACGSGGNPAPADLPQTLLVTGEGQETSYTVADLEALGSSEAAFSDVTYKGVPLSALLADAGFDAAQLKAVKALAADGYSINYDPALFQRSDVLVGYAAVDGPLADEDGIFRMVLPGEEGKLNLRMLTELQAIP